MSVMTVDQERMKQLLTETIVLLCKNGLSFRQDVRVQGLLGITVDGGDVFLVQIDEKMHSQSVIPSRDAAASLLDNAANAALVVQPKSEPIEAIEIVPDSRQPSLEQRHAERDFSTSLDTHSSCAAADAIVANSEAVTLSDTDDSQDGAESYASLLDCHSSTSLALQPFDASFALMQAGPTSTPGIDFDSTASATMPLFLPDSLEPTPKRTRKPDCVGSNRQLLPETVRQINSIATAEDVFPEGTTWQLEDEMQDMDSSALLNGATGAKTVKSSCTRRGTKSDEKRFCCQYESCQKAFFRKDHLVRHQRQKHGKPFGIDSQVVFYCYEDHCDRVFYRTCTLRRHMIDAHGYDPEETAPT